MNRSPISKRLLIVSLIIGTISALILAVGLLTHDNTYGAICPSGKNSIIYLRIDNKIDVLIDGGSEKQIVMCLSKHMPFFDRRLEWVLLGSLSKESLSGYLHLSDRYTIENLVIEQTDTSSPFVEELTQTLEEKGTLIHPFYAIYDSTIEQTDITLIKATPYRKNANTSIAIVSDMSSTSVFFPHGSYIGLTADYINYVREYIQNSDILYLSALGFRNDLILDFITLADPTMTLIKTSLEASEYAEWEEGINELDNSGREYVLFNDDEDYRFRLPQEN